MEKEKQTNKVGRWRVEKELERLKRESVDGGRGNLGGPETANLAGRETLMYRLFFKDGGPGTGRWVEIHLESSRESEAGVRNRYDDPVPCHRCLLHLSPGLPSG